MSQVAVAIPTPQEVAEGLRKVREIISELTVHHSYTIQDYPIGGTKRGCCRLKSEYRKGHGFRMSRQTTDKHGRWCRPKESTYHDAPIVVVSGPALEREAGWLEISFRGIHLYAANWDSTTLMSAPCTSKPHREDRPYKMNGVPKVLPADDPAKCDAWDVWEPAIRELQQWALAKHKEVTEAAKAAAQS